MGKSKEWYDIWQRAYANTPYRLRWTDHHDNDKGKHLLPLGWKGEDSNKKWQAWHEAVTVGRYREAYGQLSLMCRLLDLPMLSKFGGRCGHLRISAYLERGSRPRDPKIRRKAKLLASHLGPDMAMRKIKKLGLKANYIKP